MTLLQCKNSSRTWVVFAGSEVYQELSGLPITHDRLWKEFWTCIKRPQRGWHGLSLWWQLIGVLGVVWGENDGSESVMWGGAHTAVAWLSVFEAGLATTYKWPCFSLSLQKLFCMKLAKPRPPNCKKKKKKNGGNLHMSSLFLNICTYLQYVNFFSS